MSVDNPFKFAEKYSINSPRLNNWNYSTPGIYFITICTVHHNKFFGKIVDGQIELSDKGMIAREELLKTFIIRKNIKLIDWVIMPNHVHLMFYVGDFQVETPGLASLQEDSKQISVISGHKNHPMFYKNMGIKSKKIVSVMIQQFKGAVKRRVNNENLFFAWQPRFHDEIIRDAKRFFVIKQYIKNNPKNWERDEYNR